MRGRTIIISLAAILSVVLVSSAVFASGVLNTSVMSLFYTPVEPDQEPGGTVFVDPAVTIVDYLNDLGYQVGDVFPIHVNITGVTTGIYTYAINLTWNSAVLNFSALSSYGDFLYQTNTPEPEKTSRIAPTFLVDYGAGTASIAETILGNDPDGVTGQGRLFTVNFEVVGYGYSDIVIEDGTGTSLPTELLDSTEPVPVSLAFVATNGYFRNALFGDANIDLTVDVFDVLKVIYHRSGPPAGPGGYLREADINDDVTIDVFDILIVLGNLGRSVTLP